MVLYRAGLVVPPSWGHMSNTTILRGGSPVPSGVLVTVDGTTIRGDGSAENPIHVVGGVGSTGPTGPTGPMGPTGPTGPTGATFGAATHPSRTLGTPFQPSTTHQTLCIYSITVLTSITGNVGLGSVGRVELRSDAANPPTTVQCSSGGTLTANPNTIPAGVSFTTAGQFVLSFVVPANHFVELVGVAGQSTPAPGISLDFATEIPFG